MSYFVVLNRLKSTKPFGTVKIGRHFQKDRALTSQMPQLIRKYIVIKPLKKNSKRGRFLKGRLFSYGNAPPGRNFSGTKKPKIFI